VVGISAKVVSKVVVTCYQSPGVKTGAVSTLVSSPLPDPPPPVDTLAIPPSAAARQLTLLPFLIDSLGQRSVGPQITLNVQSTSNSVTPPDVSFGLTKRVEVTDTLHVVANHPAGISTIGYEITTLAGVPLVADSMDSDGSITSLLRTFNLALPVTTFPTKVIVRGFARNANDIRD